MFFVLFWCDDIKNKLKKGKYHKKKERKVTHCKWKKSKKKRCKKKVIQCGLLL
jgi:hypothetical protein